MSDGLKNAVYAALTEQGYLPNSKTDRMAVVDICVDLTCERIAQAIEAYATTMDERWGHVSPVSVVLFNAARIARQGGQE